MGNRNFRYYPQLYFYINQTNIKSFYGRNDFNQKVFYGRNDFSQKVFPYLCDDTVNGTQYHKNTKRFTTKIPNDLPQKHQTICHKNTKRNATKTPNGLRNPQEISVLCLVFNV